MWNNPYRNFRYWHKGQTHCHSSESWPELLRAGRAVLDVVGGLGVKEPPPPPKDVALAYKRMGYDFICITDHNTVTVLSQDSGLVPIVSAEDGCMHRHHIIVLGVNMDVVKGRAGVRVEDHRTGARPPARGVEYFDSNRSGICDWKTKPCENLPGRLEYYTRVQGAVAVLAHPHSSHKSGLGFSLPDLLRSTDYAGIEIYSAGEDPQTAFCLDWWDTLLQKGRLIWGFGSDDCHNTAGNTRSFNRSWILVNCVDPPGKAISADILDNIRRGNFCTVVRSPGPVPAQMGTREDGPKLMSIRATGAAIQVDTASGYDDAIEFWTLGGLRSKRPGPHAEFSPRDAMREGYVRVVVSGKRNGIDYQTYCQPLFAQGYQGGVPFTVVPTRPGSGATHQRPGE